MCGIAGIVSLAAGRAVDGLSAELDAMSRLIAHRGPDGEGSWLSSDAHVGLVHRRLAVIDLSPAAAQPMQGPADTVIAYNGEVYNYLELRNVLSAGWSFRTTSDTEVILAAFHRWGEACVEHLRGMFAFAIWDGRQRKLFAARDRFGIKPFHFAQVRDRLYFASEVKALVPFLPQIETCPEALAEYLTFQYTIGEKTLFRGISTLPPAYTLVVADGEVKTRRYWDVQFDIDHDHSSHYFVNRFRDLLTDSINLHLRADVPIGSYISGGLDSGVVACLASRAGAQISTGFHGRFAGHPDYDESRYADLVSEAAGADLQVADITARDFHDHIGQVIYHNDFPVAGPGAFPQFVVSALAARHVKVVLSGLGGDELLGGYARYLLAYFEQCIKAAIEGTYHNGNYVVTIESIIPNLGLLQDYKPMIKEFWREGLFDDLDRRYFRLIDRSTDMTGEIEWSLMEKGRVFDEFCAIFNNRRNVRKEAYFDKMTHFDFKCLLPALLHVEDRMSMAHGLESRVPFLDHPLVEFLATVPADVKFKSGQTKQLMKMACGDVLPEAVLGRRNKMGFPVPLKEWYEGPLRNFMIEVFSEQRARHRPFFNSDVILQSFDRGGRFSRKTWGLLALELWHQKFHDRAAEFRKSLVA